MKITFRKTIPESYRPRTDYNKYLEIHKGNAMRAYEYYFKPMLEQEGLSQVELDELSQIIASHDSSKYDASEYEPYYQYYYGPHHQNKQYTPEELSAYDLAWNHHQKTNPHHWQYWLLVKDGGEMVPLDMPLKYIIEMLCDWYSVGCIYGNNTCSWYNENKDKIILSDATRALVDKYIKYLESRGL